MPSPADSIRTLARMGIVVRRSTIPWVRYRPCSSSSRAIVNSMLLPSPHLLLLYIILKRIRSSSKGCGYVKIRSASCRVRAAGRVRKMRIAPDTPTAHAQPVHAARIIHSRCRTLRPQRYPPLFQHALEALDGGAEGRVLA